MLDAFKSLVGGVVGSVVLLGVFYAGDSLFGTAFSPRAGLEDDLITLTLIVGFSFSPAGLANPCRGFLST